MKRFALAIASLALTLGSTGCYTHGGWYFDPFLAVGVGEVCPDHQYDNWPQGDCHHHGYYGDDCYYGDDYCEPGGGHYGHYDHLGHGEAYGPYYAPHGVHEGPVHGGPAYHDGPAYGPGPYDEPGAYDGPAFRRGEAPEAPPATAPGPVPAPEPMVTPMTSRRPVRVSPTSSRRRATPISYRRPSDPVYDSRHIPADAPRRL